MNDTTNTASSEAPINPLDINDISEFCHCNECIYDASHAYDDSYDNDDLPF